MSAHGGNGGGVGVGVGVGVADRRSQRVTPFWILQATEILSVVALAYLSLHVSRGGVLVVAGAV